MLARRLLPVAFLLTSLAIAPGASAVSIPLSPCVQVSVEPAQGCDMYWCEGQVIVSLADRWCTVVLAGAPNAS